MLAINVRHDRDGGGVIQECRAKIVRLDDKITALADP